MVNSDAAPQDASTPGYVVVGRVPVEGFPFHDPLDGDLDAIYASQPLLSAETIHWGLLYQVNPGRWTPPESFALDGADWQARFLPKGTIAAFHSENPEEPLAFDGCLISVDTKCSGSANAARDVGRSAVREAAALLMTCTQLIAGRPPVWEGAFYPLPNGNVGSTTSRTHIRVLGVTATEVRSRVQRLTSSGVKEGTDISVRLARHWYLRGNEETRALDRFINFWLASAALYERHRPTTGADREKRGIRTYVIDLAGRVGMSPTVRDDIVRRLVVAYDLRNEVFHEGKFQQVSTQAAADLDVAASMCIRYEAGFRNDA